MPTAQAKGNLYKQIKEFVFNIVVVSLDVICEIKNSKAFLPPIETDLIKTTRKNFLMVESTQGDKPRP
jgi:hypothetical protein